MVKLLKQSSISLHFENTKGQRVDYKGTNANRSTTFRKNIKADRTKDNIFLKPKDIDRTYGGGWMTFGGWIQEPKAIRKNAVKDGGSSAILTGRYHQGKAEEIQIEALKEAYEELKEMYGEREYPFHSVVNETTTPSAL